MANEGIMAMPQGMSTQEEMPRAEQVKVSSADAYDAAQTALQRARPEEYEMLKASLRENVADLEISPRDMATLIDMLEYMSQHPAEYTQLRQNLIDNDILDPEDLPEEYDVEFIGSILSVLNELQLIQAQGAMAPLMDMPAVEGADAMQGINGGQPLSMAQGGLADVSAYLAAQGRNGDTLLAHITPAEARLLKSRGGAGTINPVTGLPEYFKKFFKSVTNVVKKVLASPVGRILATVALAAVLGPVGVGLSLGTAAGVASAGITLLGGGSVKEALISGAMGYIGGGGTIMGVNPVSAVGAYLPGAAGGALNTGLTTGLIGAGIGKIAGMSNQEALKMGLTSGASAAALAGLKGTSLDPSGTPTAEPSAQPSAQPDAGPIGPTGTASDLLAAQRLNAPAPSGEQLINSNYSLAGGNTTAPSADGSTFSGFKAPALSGKQIINADYSLSGKTPTASLTDMGSYGGSGLRADLAPGMRPSAANNYSLASSPPPAAPTSSPSLLNRALSGAKEVYNEYLSPSRPGLAPDAGFLTKYGPLALAGTAIVSATGGTKTTPSDPNPAFDRNYTGLDYMRDNPNMFSGGLGRYTPPSDPVNPIVPTPSYDTIPINRAANIMPVGISAQPQGISQPYNVAGLYGVPLLYGQDNQPRNYARGGETKVTQFPRKTGPINGPGTGTSDDIPAMLSDGEFVFTAKSVRNAGGGSRRKGAARMYKLMKMLEGGPVKGK